jgi:hypothetical protein
MANGADVQVTADVAAPDAIDLTTLSDGEY